MAINIKQFMSTNYQQWPIQQAIWLMAVQLLSVNAAHAEHHIDSAFMGLENGTPIGSDQPFQGNLNQDGMPVVFSHEIDVATLNARDFQIIASNGRRFRPVNVTTRPANEDLEQRTVLLLGQFSDYPDWEPVEVRIVNDLLSIEGFNYDGQTIAVTPLLDGPFISHAEWFRYTESYPYVAGGANVAGADGPADSRTIVRVVFAGGVRAADGNELTDADLELFTVQMDVGGEVVTLSPDAFGDLNDGDNNVDLCFETEGIPLSVAVEPGTVIDPNNDPNSFTQDEVVPSNFNNELLNQ